MWLPRLLRDGLAMKVCRRPRPGACQRCGMTKSVHGSIRTPDLSARSGSSMQLSGAAEPSLRRSLPLTVREVVVERTDAGGSARRILNRASLLIEPGMVLAVTGPSGAGKTTLLHAIAGLVIPDDGTVSWGIAPSRRCRRASATAGAATRWAWFSRTSSWWKTSACWRIFCCRRVSITANAARAA